MRIQYEKLGLIGMLVIVLIGSFFLTLWLTDTGTSACVSPAAIVSEGQLDLRGLIFSLEKRELKNGERWAKELWSKGNGKESGTVTTCHSIASRFPSACVLSE